MVLTLQLAFYLLLAALILLCVIFAKLREMDEAGQASSQRPVLRPLKDGEGVVLRSGRRGQVEFRRRVRFQGDDRRRDGLNVLLFKSGETDEEDAANRNFAREIEIEKESEETGNDGAWPDNQEVGRDNDDDWEGIEKTEVERAFDRAVLFFNSLKASGLGFSGMGYDQKMKLYGLHKVATEGPCHESPPLPFRVSARAKWNAWWKLGNMSPHDAMKQYIDLVSAISPQGMQIDTTASAQL
ncbi:hypothetical protein SAY86_021920 [Trapa natans]|uniref:ACB domain-containing protein n=1 Tax=Trapa natans TaxID=22666 RepID=A0AAN7M2T0_TRANT|nr:hypothetical protein SAY86_021920 [Trapa natans]